MSPQRFPTTATAPGSATLGCALALLFALASALPAVADHHGEAPDYDVLILNGRLFDGSGASARHADLAIRGDRIVAIGELSAASAEQRIDATGLAVSPGFINTLSWAVQSLREDGRGISDVAQGVTLEVFGEGWSMGPVPERGLDSDTARNLDMRAGEHPPWRTLDGYLSSLEASGIAPNVASFVGATTLRMHELGMQDRAATPAELERMQELAREAMRQGALGLGSSLIYPPGFFASTDELVALASAVGEYEGMYISHLRNEGNQLDQAIDELLEIAARADVRAEIYHLKLAGRSNWENFDAIVAKIEAARARGVDVAANMYTYPAGATGLTASLPPWTGEGGIDARVDRINDPATRERILREMREEQDDWDNLLRAAGPEGVLISGFDNPGLSAYEGRYLDEVAAAMQLSPEEAVLELIARDHSRVDAIYFLMDEDNVGRKVALPWVSFGSDARTYSASGEDLEKVVHPRAYGTFARVLGRYVRDEQRLSLAAAIHKLSGLPAQRLRLRERGLLREGFYADVVIFDPGKIADHASFARPHRLASGVHKVFVNGKAVWSDGAATGALPGRVVRGPGYERAKQLDDG